MFERQTKAGQPRWARVGDGIGRKGIPRIAHDYGLYLLNLVADVHRTMHYTLVFSSFEFLSSPYLHICWPLNMFSYHHTSALILNVTACDKAAHLAGAAALDCTSTSWGPMTRKRAATKSCCWAAFQLAMVVPPAQTYTKDTARSGCRKSMSKGFKGKKYRKNLLITVSDGLLFYFSFLA